MGLFVGETGQVPADAPVGSQCSLGVFPTGPAPFADFDPAPGDMCGDFANSASATLEVRNVRVLCTPATGTNQLAVPYTLVFDSPPANNTCTASNITAGTNAKCIKSSAATVTGVEVNGFVTITKQTIPDGDSADFTFNASSSETVSPASAMLSDGESQTFEVPLSPSGPRRLTITEAVLSGWEPTASISCTSPGGGPASYVTVDSGTRTIQADLDPTNFGAVCTITNTKTQPSADLVTAKTLVSGDATPSEGDTVTYAITVTNDGPDAATGV
ncbi:prealbumin-like fold domain-containing protein, partial [Roseivivax sp. CAU 1753]